MTIKEVEQCLGVPRATVRFYEKEGLLSPTREENGYRDYSQEDVVLLIGNIFKSLLCFLFKKHPKIKGNRAVITTGFWAVLLIVLLLILLVKVNC